MDLRRPHSVIGSMVLIYTTEGAAAPRWASTHLQAGPWCGAARVGPRLPECHLISNEFEIMPTTHNRQPTPFGGRPSLPIKRVHPRLGPCAPSLDRGLCLRWPGPSRNDVLSILYSKTTNERDERASRLSSVSVRHLTTTTFLIQAAWLLGG